MKAGQASQNRDQLLAAARLNWRLWTILQSELLDPECPVSHQLRENLLSLARFIDKRTVDFLAEPQTSKLDILIGINREIAGGLSVSPVEAAAGCLPQADGDRPVRITT